MCEDVSDVDDLSAADVCVLRYRPARVFVRNPVAPHTVCVVEPPVGFLEDFLVDFGEYFFLPPLELCISKRAVIAVGKDAVVEVKGCANKHFLRLE